MQSQGIVKSPTPLLDFENLLIPELENPPIPGLIPNSGLEIPPNVTLEISNLESSAPKKPYIKLASPLSSLLLI